MVDGKKDEGAGDHIKILLEEVLEKKRNTIMDKFAQILQRLPINGTSTSSTSANRSATYWANPIPSSEEFSPHGCVEIICTKHAYDLDSPDLTLFNFMQDTESFYLLIFCGKLISHTCKA